MITRKLAGCEVSILGIGTGRLASLGSGHTENDALKLLEKAEEKGINFIDTADTYGSAQCERLLGKLLVGRQGKFLLSTKAGYPCIDFPFPMRSLNQFGKKIAQKCGVAQNFQADYIAKCIGGSLRRLRRNRLDFFFLHNPPGPVWQDDALKRVLEDAKEKGDILHAGVSSDSMEILLQASEIPLFEVFQTQINPLSAKSASLKILEKSRHTPCVVANHVFAAGQLINPTSPTAEVVNSIARELEVPKGHILLAFAAAQPGVATVLSGTANHNHLVDNARGLTLCLTPDQLNRLNSLHDS